MISVIIPVYNAEKTIETALLSIKNQNWDGAFEIIIVNDGSTDNSRNIIEHYMQINEKENITLINQENSGVSRARNVAMKKATGDYIAFLDADDEWLPEKTAQQMKIFGNLNLQIDFLGALRNKQVLKYPYTFNAGNLAEITFKKLMFRNETQPSTVIFTKIILKNTGFFDEKQRYAEDLNYWLKISHRNKMYILNDELVFYGGGKRSFGVSGLSSNLIEMEKGFQKNLKEMLVLKHIHKFQYVLYFIFYKIKFAVRLVRNKYIKLGT
ncbi:glycosyltransferase family 2 protein [Chryseobacterium sp. MP_3.2]|uniref:glycosyltransferase family 2 protein n=1 Tax=Chryseobacterium sp. MP_3.2 TaxID=3071712 RepID=UPI002DFA32A7|nr:glycosyltransferase involved in cell wall biosynthesis [Chryseobacterium sp. MP_3.2]